MTKKSEKKTIAVGGECVEVNIGDNVVDTLGCILGTKGWDVYSIIIDGKEITDISKMPLTFEQCKTVEVTRQVTAGGKMYV